MLKQYVYPHLYTMFKIIKDEAMHLFRYVCAASALLLSACSSDTVKDTLGLERAAPDEFRVVSRPPLSVPPEFTLRPPASSDLPAGQAPATAQAKAIVFGDGAVDIAPQSATATASKTVSRKNTPSKADTADSQFLKNAGIDQANPKIRDELVEEHYNKASAKEDCSWWDISCVTPEKKDPVVDAAKETGRIKDTTNAGEPITKGETPTIKQHDSGVLGRVLGN